MDEEHGIKYFLVWSKRNTLGLLLGVSQSQHKVVRVHDTLDFLERFRTSSADLRVLKETGKKSAAGKRLINDLVMEQGVLVTVDKVGVAQGKTDELKQIATKQVTQMTDIVDDT